MGVVRANLIGRFGNTMFQYAYAKAFAIANGHELSTPEWVGEKIFHLDPSVPNSDDAIVLEGYKQDQASMIYSRSDVKKWFRVRDKWSDMFNCCKCRVVAHRRVGDYASCGYVVVSLQSYIKAFEKFGYDANKVEICSEENPGTLYPKIPNLPFLGDFLTMLNSEVLFRGNSSFSWWAATLSDARVFSPVIEGLEGGKEQDCEFVEGNHPRLANLEFVTDLYVH